MYSGNGNDQFANNWQMQINSLSANNAQIDWAQLAQNWINMREIRTEEAASTQGSELLDAPPPPKISSRSYHQLLKQHFEEKGEAEMDIEDDEPTASQFETIPLQLPVPTPRVQPVLNYHLTQYQTHQDWQWPPRVQLPPPVLHIPQVSTSGTTSQERHEKPVESLDENKRKSLPAWIR